MSIFNYEKEDIGYKKFNPTTNNVKNNIGKKVKYIDCRNSDIYRGIHTVELGVLHSKYYNTIYFNEMEKQININDLIDICIEL